MAQEQRKFLAFDEAATYFYEKFAESAPQRFDKYLQAAGGNHVEAIARYRYNLELSASLLPALHAAELTLRNSIHQAMCLHYLSPKPGKAKPTESPIGYPLTLCGRRLLDPPRRTSYCSGASYAAFIEGLGLWMAKERVVWSPPSDFETSPFANVSFERPVLTAEQVETLRMQELDGGRRDDGVKFWGNWNADGFGNQMALVQYSGMGTRIKPSEARPGDFLNISWKSGIGHSTVFLGWCLTKDGEKAVRYWSSQTGTNGLGDAVALLSKISSICLVRVTHPERVLSIRSSAPVQPKVLGDAIDW